jgi:hypothetical protein
VANGIRTRSGYFLIFVKNARKGRGYCLSSSLEKKSFMTWPATIRRLAVLNCAELFCRRLLPNWPQHNDIFVVVNCSELSCCSNWNELTRMKIKKMAGCAGGGAITIQLPYSGHFDMLIRQLDMSTPLAKVFSRTGAQKTRTTGWAWRDEATCRHYFADRVAKRLKQSDASAFLSEFLQRMPDTGFSPVHLKLEASGSKAPRVSEIGEAFAESVLEDFFECHFPWPTGCDRRETTGNPTGPDMPGFHLPQASKARFAFGEVKSSSQADSPPIVVLGVDQKGTESDCLVAQLRRLLTETERRQTLIAWLGFRATIKSNWKQQYDSTFNHYCVTGDCLVLGCLIRGGVVETEADLVDAEVALAPLTAERELWLFAFYVPFHKSKWQSIVMGKDVPS